MENNAKSSGNTAILEHTGLTHVVQTIRFKTKAGVTSSQLLDANDRYQREVAPYVPGLQQREVHAADGGEWVMTCRYVDMDHALRGMHADDGPAATGLIGLIDVGSMHTSYDTVDITA